MICIALSASLLNPTPFRTEMNQETKNMKMVEAVDINMGQPFFNTAQNKAVILDVDMSTDVDDVCAVRVATAMDSAGVIDLKGIMYCVTGENNIEALRGLLVHDGHPDVLIGECSVEEPDISPYWDTLAAYNDGGGDVDTSVRQYRKILQHSETPVDIVVTGYVTNLEYLLKSEPDDISPLSGKELVQKKVGQLYVVGGSYPDGFSNNFHFTRNARQSIDYVNKNWGKPIVFSPGQTGGPLVCGKLLQDIDIKWEDVVTRSLYNFGTDRGRAAWDPFGVWICGLGCSDITQVNLQRVDLITSADSDSSTFVPNEDGRHYVVFRNHDNYQYWNDLLDSWLLAGYGYVYY